MSTATTDEERRWRLRAYRVWTVVGVAALLFSAVYAAGDAVALLAAPVALAVLAVYVLDPLVTRLQRFGVRRGVGTLLVFVVLGGAVVTAVVQLAPVVAAQASLLVDQAPEIAASVESWLNSMLAHTAVDMRVTLDPTSEDLQRWVRDAIDAGAASGVAGTLASGVGTVAAWAGGLVLAVAVTPVLAFYALADLPRLRLSARRLVSASNADAVTEAIDRVGFAVGGFLRGQALIAVFVGATSALALWLVDLPFWALVGVVSGVANIVPLIGPLVAGAAGVLVALTVGGGVGQAALVVVAMVVVQQVESQLLSPYVMSRTVSLRPVSVLLVVLFSGLAFGVVGMLLAVPFTAAAKMLWLQLVIEPREAREITAAQPSESA